MIKDIKDSLVQVNLVNHSILELLIEKEILTEEEVKERLIHNQRLMLEAAKEFADLINETNKNKELKSNDEELLGMYFGPIGKA